MIKTHKIDWQHCLSHQIWPAIQKGWPDEGRPVHFFWGLAGNNLREIQRCIDFGIEWWYVDVGYLTQQITRYPEPKIHDYSKTYFRICKGNIHTIRCKVGDGTRVSKLESQGIDINFKGWGGGETTHILVAPSSPTVTYHINGISQEEWTKEVTTLIKAHTDMPIRFRNKPRPNNEWWETDIRDDLKDCHALVTNMSLSAVDAVMNMVPVFTHQRHICSFISSKDLTKINKPMKPGHKTMNEWIKMVADNQFTIQEIESGIAYEILKEQI
tara:strand:+ start:1342 stop:2151 length:810 start_codon:yes stop_codon:yes gene_type:complete